MKKQNKQWQNSGVLLPAGMFIGIGIGLLTGQVAAFTLIGMGCGFFAMWFARKK